LGSGETGLSERWRGLGSRKALQEEVEEETTAAAEDEEEAREEREGEAAKAMV
jgi:hypothetical protein